MLMCDIICRLIDITEANVSTPHELTKYSGFLDVTLFKRELVGYRHFKNRSFVFWHRHSSKSLAL